jgi:hypothetical protein
MFCQKCESPSATSPRPARAARPRSARDAPRASAGRSSGP